MRNNLFAVAILAAAFPAPVGAQTTADHSIPSTAAELVASLYAFSMARPAEFEASLDALTDTQTAHILGAISPCLTSFQNQAPYQPGWNRGLPDYLPRLPDSFGNSQVWASDLRRTMGEGLAWTDTPSGQSAGELAATRPLLCGVAAERCAAAERAAQDAMLAQTQTLCR